MLVRFPGRGGPSMADAVNRPAYWLSDGPVTATLWTRLHADHGRSGLWPLLPEGLDDEPARPWLVGEVDPEPVSDIDEHDPAGFFAKRWAANVAPPKRRVAPGVPGGVRRGLLRPGVAAGGGRAELGGVGAALRATPSRSAARRRGRSGGTERRASPRIWSEQGLITEASGERAGCHGRTLTCRLEPEVGVRPGPG